MKIEHFALNVADPRAMAAWYRDSLGMEIMREMAEAPYTHFLADSSGTIMIEIYNNPADDVPAYGEMNPQLLHVAFVSQDPEADKQALLAAGATLVSDNGGKRANHLVMLRDPWGLAIQLCKRQEPMLKGQ